MATPAPTSERIYVTLDDANEATVEITITTRGLGAVDPPIRRAPTARDLHRLADSLARRIYQFHPEI